MSSSPSSRHMMYAQIVSQPALLGEVFEQTDHCVHEVLRRFQGEQWQAIYTAGCGDSFYAGLACEMAFARFCRLPVKALPAMHFARYEVDNVLTPAVLFGISNSGAVSRTIEAVAMARDAGLDTIAVTGHGASSITQEAAATVAIPIPPMGRAPGIRSYTVQLLTLFLCALRLGEIRQVLAAEEAARWRQRLRHGDEYGRKRLPQTMRLCAAWPSWRDQEDWVFVGAGPSYATALFCAAKTCGELGARLGTGTRRMGPYPVFQPASANTNLSYCAAGPQCRLRPGIVTLCERHRPLHYRCSA